MKNNTKEWIVIGFYFGIGLSSAEQLMWYFFDIIKLMIGHPLG